MYICILFLRCLAAIEGTTHEKQKLFKEISGNIAQKTVGNKYLAPVEVAELQRNQLEEIWAEDVLFDSTPGVEMMHLSTLCTVMQTICRHNADENDREEYERNFHHGLMPVVSRIEDLAQAMADGWKYLFYVGDALRELDKYSEKLGLSAETTVILNGRYFNAMEAFVVASKYDGKPENVDIDHISEMFLWMEQGMQEGNLIFDTLDYCITIIDNDGNAARYPRVSLFKTLWTIWK